MARENQRGETGSGDKSMRGRATYLRGLKVSVATSAGNRSCAHRTPSRPLEPALEVGSARRYLGTRGPRRSSVLDYSGDRVCRKVDARAASGGETWRATVCKSLQAYRCSAVSTRRATPELEKISITTCVFNRLLLIRKLAVPGGLAPCLRSGSAQAYGKHSKGSGQIAGKWLLSTPGWEPPQAPDGRACEGHFRAVEHRACHGSSFLGMHGVERVARIRTSEICVTGASCL